MRKSYGKISPTAKLVAYLRTFTDIPYAKEIALESGAKKTFQELAGESEESMVRFFPFSEARYKVTDRILAEHDMTQVLEIAAGLSPRGLEMTRNPDVVYVVTDLPEMLEVEETIAETILTKSNSHRSNLHFQVANCLDMESLSKAAMAFKFDRPLAIITEGLIPYLNRRETGVLAGNIHEVLEKYGGLWIATEVHTKGYWQEISQLDEKLIRKRLSAISSSTGSDFESNAFADKNDVEQFFGKAGFKIEEYSHSKVLEDLSSVKLLNLNQEEKQKIRRGLEIFKTLILTPRNT
ncbi:MAG: class I SAM-dependent methyltransferase [Candidatus Bathyarchaeia archaeon]|jgi:O-methyltransferase involved in polyketide biosynthesis